MARTILYVPREAEGLEFGQRVRKPRAYRPEGSYADRLARYIPGEALGAFEVGTFIKGSNTGILIGILIGCVFGNLLYLWIQSEKAKRARAKGERTLRHFYVLSTLALLIWAAAMDSQTADLFGLGEAWSRFLLIMAVYLFPLLDTACALLGF
jgi:hypothetical protein